MCVCVCECVCVCACLCVSECMRACMRACVCLCARAPWADGGVLVCVHMSQRICIYGYFTERDLEIIIICIATKKNDGGKTSRM